MFTQPHFNTRRVGYIVTACHRSVQGRLDAHLDGWRGSPVGGGWMNVDKAFLVKTQAVKSSCAEYASQFYILSLALVCVASLAECVVIWRQTDSQR